MKSFIKTVLAVITGIILSSVIFFFFMIMMIGVMISSGKKPVVVSDKSVLVLKTGVQIPDRGNPNPSFTFDLMNMTMSPTTGLNDILANLKRAEEDPKIKGVIIETGILPSGWATASEVRQALLKFRESGKFVISYTDYILTQESYYVSTAADRIYINPAAIIELQGISAEVMFFKKALEKIGVEVQIIRHGKFKGAVEPFLLDRLSDENREQIASFTGSIWNSVVNDISAARKLEPAEINRIADLMLAFDPDEALRLNLIDGLLYKDMLSDTLRMLCEIDPDKKIKTVSMAQYSKVPEPKKKSVSEDKIAVIYASGSIVMGKGNETNIGGNAYAEAIREARRDSSVKAIVLRVNSPGGDAIASELIWREADLARQVKPVVVSMGNYAASGGYYISAPATKIICNPATITGSIGVFGRIPNVGKLLNDKIGITTEVVKTNQHSDAPSITRALTTYEQQVIQNSIKKTYGTFVGHVAEGRGMTFEAVDNIGEGRVWSGTEALSNGLADKAGGLSDAIAEAAELAELETYSVKELPELVDPYTRIIKELTGDVRLKLAERELGQLAGYISDLREMSTLTGIQARLPYFINLR
ncbi:MAG: signal peptide peptidase SppA [Bacteroidales bacterium]